MVYAFLWGNFDKLFLRTLAIFFDGLKKALQLVKPEPYRIRGKIGLRWTQISGLRKVKPSSVSIFAVSNRALASRQSHLSPNSGKTDNMARADAKTAVLADGLRYKSKVSGSPFAATTSFGAATMSCFMCGKHRARSLMGTRKVLGKSQAVCAPSCKELDAILAAQAAGAKP